jgi:hypothetical protein
VIDSGTAVPTRSGTPRRSVIVGRRLIAGALALAVVIVVIALLASGASTQPPATAAAKLVPADALAYVNVSLDGSRPAVRQALSVARRLPDFALGAAAVERRVADLTAAGTDYATQIRPWLGNEAALALLDTPTSTAGSLLLLSVAHHARAAAFLHGTAAQADGSDHGVALHRYASGTEAAFIGGFLALGQDASVRAAIGVWAGAAGSLAASSVYRAAANGEPAGRVLDAYASADGVRRLLAPQSGVIGALGVLLYQPALAGVSIALSATPDGAQVRIHSALDASLVSAAGHRGPSFAPTLQRVIPSGSIVLLDTSELPRVAPQLLAAGAASGIAGQVAPLLSRLGAALHTEGVNVSQLESLFDGESAVAVTGGVKPALLVVARTRDQSAVRSELAAAEIPLQQLFQSSSSTSESTDTLSQTTIDGVTVHQVGLEPGLQVDDAVTDGLVAISTGSQAIAALIRRTHAVADDPGYQAVLADAPQRVTSLTYLNFSQLLGLGEQTGLTRSARFRALRGDLQQIRAVGLSSSSGETDSTAELSLQIP